VGGLFGIIAFFIKRWMNERERNEEKRDEKAEDEREKRDKKEAEIRAELVTTTAAIASDLSEKHNISVREIKTLVQGTRDFYNTTFTAITGQISEMDTKLVKRMDIANGRTKKLEEKSTSLKKAVDKVSSTCEERSKAFYKEAEKVAKKATIKKG
jgi:hypothetical protein